jgi:hypothetical protein
VLLLNRVFVFLLSRKLLYIYIFQRDSSLNDKQIFNVNFSKKVAKTAKEKRVDISIKRENLFDFVGEIEKANGKSG